MRNLLDDNFREVFEHYLLKSSAKNGELSLRTVEEFVRVGLREDSQEEVDYVMKNLHRLDKDENKTISYEELVRFDLFRENFYTFIAHKSVCKSGTKKVKCQKEHKEK